MLKLYDSLSQTIRPFEPIHPNQVTMYVCGPTVYGDIHIGNARPVIFFDMLKRYLKHIGYDVFYVSNITDVDDRIIEKAIQSGKPESEITSLYIKNFEAVTKKIKSLPPDQAPRATDYIKQMIRYIERLIAQGHAYVKPNGVYFKVTSIDDYGILSKQNIDDLDQGVRINLEDEKDDPRDFSLWKNTTEGIQYDSPWGKGRPGWHTECACMNDEIFHGEIDIHGGGTDLKFPHHENEIAQAKALSNHHLARTWMHVGRLDMNQEKMSKSLGNTILLKDLLKNYDGEVFRFMMLSHHYRSRINYTDELMVQYQKEYDKINRTMQKTKLEIRHHFNDEDPKHLYDQLDPKLMATFREHMDDDINTPNVLTLMQEAIKTLNKSSDMWEKRLVFSALNKILNMFGIRQKPLPSKYIDIYDAWQQARNNKNYDQADTYRKALMEQGWI